MKRRMFIVMSATAVLVASLGGAVSIADNGDAAKEPQQIRIESWLVANQVAGDLSGTVKGCFKLTDGHQDVGGAPAWTDETYASVPDDPATLTDKCGDWTPVGGFVFGPTMSADHPEYSTLYAVHTLPGTEGLIFITFAGHYDLQTTFQGEGTWVITGGTGAYSNVHGEGTWAADASTFPYIRHTEQGTMWNSPAS